MNTETLGGLTCRIVRRPRATSTVVLLHGFGAPGDDLVSLADLLPTVHCVFPHAPIALGGMFGAGRAWWHIDLERLQRDMARATLVEVIAREPDGLAAASTTLCAALPAIAQFMGTPLRLGGFSQGAMLSTDAVLAGADVAGLAILSGSYVAAARWEPHFDRVRGLDIVMTHGDADPLLPMAATEALRQRLEQASANLQWTPFRGGHEIPATAVRALAAWALR